MIYVCELLLSVQVGSKLADQVLRQQRRRSVMRRGDRAQAASGVQNDLSIGTPCQANDQCLGSRNGGRKFTTKNFNGTPDPKSKCTTEL